MTFRHERLGDHVTYLQRGKSPRYSDDGEVRVLNQKCVRWHGFELHHGRRLATEAADTLLPVRLLQPGDVLVNSTGEGTIGRANVWIGSADERWVADSHITVIRPAEELDSDWLRFWLQSAEGQEIIKAAKTGATKQTELATSKIASFKLPLPPRSDQRRILLRIKACMQRVEKIEELRTQSWVRQQHISASLIESELQAGFASADWAVRSIGEIVTTVRNGRSIRQDTEGNANGAVLTLTAVRTVDLGLSFKKPIILPDEVATQFAIEQGDVFVSRANTIELVGLSAITMERSPARLIYPDLLIKLKVDRSKILPRFLVYALRGAGARTQIKKRAFGSSQTMVKISGERLREVSIPVPPLPMQERIVSRLDAAHELVASLSAESDASEIHALRAAVLRKAFAGDL